MNKQTEIKESTVLLMPDGNLARPGYLSTTFSDIIPK